MTRAAGGGARGLVLTRPAFLDRPLSSLHLVVATGALLLTVGVVMVFSASMVDSYDKYGTTYAVFTRQLMWMAIGIPVFWLGLRLSPHSYRRLAYPALLLSVAALVLVLVPGVGLAEGGAQRWIVFGPLNFQPSEPAKLALALWGADLLVRKERMLRDWRHLLIPLVPVSSVLCALVMLEPDLGTTLCFLFVLFGLLWTVGAPGRLFATLGGIAVLAVTVLIIIEPYRLQRLTAFLDPFQDRAGAGYQPVQGLYSLSTGGLFGVGLGESKMKWGRLPNAHTDYIFAILGEELGLVGCLVVLALFAILAYTGVRIARRTSDPFVRLATGAVTVWLTGQAVVNIGYVIGLLPVTGIPLPLISFGGTSLVLSMFLIGMLASFARHEPAAVRHYQSRGRGTLAKVLRLPAPKAPEPRRRPTRPRPRPHPPGRSGRRTRAATVQGASRGQGTRVQVGVSRLPGPTPYGQARGSYGKPPLPLARAAGQRAADAGRPPARDARGAGSSATTHYRPGARRR